MKRAQDRSIKMQAAKESGFAAFELAGKMHKV